MTNLSIVIVTKNNLKELKFTLKSISKQTYKKNIELIIVNGGREINNKIIPKDLRVISKKDNSVGIYNAMNIGLKQAKGNHILFLNSGDSLNSNLVLKNIKNYSLSKNVSYFFISKVIGKTKSWNIPNNVKKIFPGDSVPVHQSILFNKKFYKKNLYNLKYSIAADYEYKLMLLRKYKVSFIPFVVSNHYLGGVSSTYSLGNYLKISKELYKIDYHNQSIRILLRNQINLLIKFLLFQLKLNNFLEIILSKIYSNKAYEIKI